MEKEIGRIEKNATESVRVHINDFKGHELFEVRVWARNSAGEFVRTQKGVCISTNYISNLKALIIKAEQAVSAERGASFTSDEETSDGGNVESAGKDGKAVKDDEADEDLFSRLS